MWSTKHKVRFALFDHRGHGRTFSHISLYKFVYYPYRSCRIWGSGGGPNCGRSFGLPYKIYGDPPGAGERSTASSGTPGGTDPRGRCPGRHVEYGGRACTLSAERTPNPASPGHVEVHMYFVWGTYTADELILERFGLRHTNTWGTHHVIWLTNECIFPKVDRWGRIYFGGL